MLQGRTRLTRSASFLTKTTSFSSKRAPCLAVDASSPTAHAMNPIPNPRQLPDENVWYAIPGYEAFSSAPPGATWRQFSHLSNRKTFSEKIRSRANIIEQCVGMHQPECSLCKNGGGYSEDLGGPKHWSKLVSFLGENVVDLDGFWNQWSIDGYLAAGICGA